MITTRIDRIQRWLRGLAVGAAAIGALCAGPAGAQGYPSKPIEMSVPFAAGGGTDVVARLLAGEMTKMLGQQVVVVNRVGAGGTLAVAHVAKAAPDGYSIGWFTGGPVVLAPIVESNLPYDPARDIIPVSQVQVTDQVIVARPGLKAVNIPELLALAKSNPGAVTMGHTGIGTSQLLAALMLEKLGGVQLNKIPYKGEAPMLADIMGDRVDMGLVTATSAEPLLKAGKIKVLSSGGPKRSHLFPNAQSMSESGFPLFDANSHMGVYVPAGTSQDIVNRLARVVADAVRQPHVRDRLQALGGSPVGSSPQEFAAFLKADRERAERMLK
jgi:tripartite-type tricarboxylate transporter receptor subunit TctC